MLRLRVLSCDISSIAKKVHFSNCPYRAVLIMQREEWFQLVGQTYEKRFGAPYAVVAPRSIFTEHRLLFNNLCHLVVDVPSLANATHVKPTWTSFAKLYFAASKFGN